MVRCIWRSFYSLEDILWEMKFWGGNRQGLKDNFYRTLTTISDQIWQSHSQSRSKEPKTWSYSTSIFTVELCRPEWSLIIVEFYTKIFVSPQSSSQKWKNRASSPTGNCQHYSITGASKLLKPRLSIDSSQLSIEAETTNYFTQVTLTPRNLMKLIT